MIPEVVSLAAPRSLVRIPPETDVPVSPRVRAVLDTAPLRRLASVSQLGLVSLVYPGAGHSRLEHSLGVYRSALLVLQHLLVDERFAEIVSPDELEAFVFAALVHDLGHWPFCHPIEDMQIEGLPKHERLAESIIQQSELCELLNRQWKCSITQVMRILTKQPQSGGESILSSILSGPIDIDKMDYLIRDSLHAGVPYGRNFDVGRLIAAFCPHPDRPQLAITEKGRTAAEMMVFARYVMFSEVYWHHAVRSATAMLQRAVFFLQGRIDLNAMLGMDDASWIARLRRVASGTLAEPLVEGLFGPQRRLFKRIAQFNVLDAPELHAALAHRPYDVLTAISTELAERISKRIGRPLGQNDVIIDAPPQKLEVDINIDVVMSSGQVRPLGSVSPVVDALARRQFDSHVKRVRVFVPEDVRNSMPHRQLPTSDLADLLARLS